MDRQEKLEALFSSQDPIDVLRFYSSITGIEELVSFASRRPEAEINITIKRERKSSGGVSVVVPTPTLGSQRVVDTLRIYDPLEVILVESSGPYFNYSRSMNRGIEKAVELDADWIILSNDDLFKVDPIENLVHYLENESSEVVMAAPGYIQNVWYHTTSVFLSKARRRQNNQAMRKFQTKYNILADYPVIKNGLHYYLQLLYYRYLKLQSSIVSFYNFGDFCVLGSKIARKHNFDEAFQNRVEDIDLSLRLKTSGAKVKVSPFRIGSRIRSTIGKSETDNLRFLLNSIYFSHKVEKLLESKDFP